MSPRRTSAATVPPRAKRSAPNEPAYGVSPTATSNSKCCISGDSSAIKRGVSTPTPGSAGAAKLRTEPLAEAGGGGQRVNERRSHLAASVATTQAMPDANSASDMAAPNRLLGNEMYTLPNSLQRVFLTGCVKISTPCKPQCNSSNAHWPRKSKRAGPKT